MREAFVTLHPLAVIVVALIGFVLGWAWYSPLLFVRAWMKEMSFTEQQMKSMKPSKGMLMLGSTILINLVSTTALAFFINEHHIATWSGGLKMGLLCGVGFVATRQTVNSIFQMKSLKLYLIVTGYDVCLFALQGAILGVWR